MTTAEKLVTVAENQQRVYDAGAKSEYDRFWDAFQAKGEGINYYYAFAYGKFDDENYNPKYPITTSGGVSTSRYLFYQSKGITDTKMPIYANGNDCHYMFSNCTGLVTIRELSVLEKQTFTETFNWCSKLQNLTITGTIGNSLSLSHSPLTKNSILSVFNALSTTVTGKTITFKQTAVEAAFTTEEWEALKATKTNWTYALA